MQNNPEIESIVDQAVKIARDKHHEYVITEHLLLSLIRHVPFRKTLDRFGVEVPQMEQEVDTYLNSLNHLVKHDEDLQPRKTQTLERLFNRANEIGRASGRERV